MSKIAAPSVAIIVAILATLIGTAPALANARVQPLLFAHATQADIARAGGALAMDMVGKCVRTGSKMVC